MTQNFFSRKHCKIKISQNYPFQVTHSVNNIPEVLGIQCIEYNAMQYNAMQCNTIQYNLGNLLRWGGWGLFFLVVTGICSAKGICF